MQEHDLDLIIVIISRRCGGAFFAGRSHLDEDECDDDEEGNANEADGVQTSSQSPHPPPQWPPHHFAQSQIRLAVHR